MNRDEAARNLEIIRTLMERSALYRRAQGPLMVLAGVFGVGGSLMGSVLGVGVALKPFVVYWGALCGVTVLGVIVMVRRQAVASREPFWSPPCRRVVQAMAPASAAALAVTAALLGTGGEPRVLAALWILFQGCSLHAAGFFVNRGIRLFGWGLVIVGATAMALPQLHNPHVVMGLGFGATHLAYGLYLLATERPTAINTP
jgi:hypothetical protein